MLSLAEFEMTWPLCMIPAGFEQLKGLRNMKNMQVCESIARTARTVDSVKVLLWWLGSGSIFHVGIRFRWFFLHFCHAYLILMKMPPVNSSRLISTYRFPHQISCFSSLWFGYKRNRKQTRHMTNFCQMIKSYRIDAMPSPGLFSPRSPPLPLL